MDWAIPKMLRSLEADETGRPLEALDWLSFSSTSRDAFYLALHRHLMSTRGLASTSTPDGMVGLYHDLVQRHVAAGRVAFEAVSWDGRITSLSYKDLDLAAGRLAANWASQGLGAGAVIALLLPAGEAFLVAWVAAIRLGAVPAPLHPAGRALTLSRLEALAPEAVATDYLREPSTRGLDVQVFLVDALLPDAAGAMGGHTYGPGDVAGRYFPTLSADPLTPRAVTAREIYQGALKLAVLTLRLAPEDRIAAPDVEPTQHLPTLLAATLLMGATFMHFDHWSADTRLRVIEKQPLAALLVSRRARDRLLEAPKASLLNTRQWIRNPLEPLDWDAWRRFADLEALKGVPCVNLVLDGGREILTSARRRGSFAVNQWVLPSPGVPWRIADVNGSGQDAVQRSGVFVPMGDAEDPPGQLVVAQQGGELFLAGCMTPRRSGQTYPAKAVSQAIASLPWCCGATVVGTLLGAHPNDAAFIAVMFRGEEPYTPAWDHQVYKDVLGVLRQEIGGGWMPDRLECIPLYPRRVDGEVDEAWCQAQFLGGSLHRKAHEPLFGALTALRGMIDALAALGAPPGGA